MQTSFASPTGFGGALTDPPWSLSGGDSTDEYYCLAGKCHVFIIDRRKVEMERKALLNDKSYYAVILLQYKVK